MVAPDYGTTLKSRACDGLPKPVHRTYGVVPGVQISHAGRKGSTARPWEGAAPLPPDGPDPSWTTVAPSPRPAQDGWPTPRALEEPEILAIVAAFQAAASRALEAGFDFIEIHWRTRIPHPYFFLATLEFPNGWLWRVASRNECGCR